MPCLALLQTQEPLLKGQLLNEASPMPTPALRRPVTSAPPPGRPHVAHLLFLPSTQEELSLC